MIHIPTSSLVSSFSGLVHSPRHVGVLGRVYVGPYMFEFNGPKCRKGVGRSLRRARISCNRQNESKHYISENPCSDYLKKADLCDPSNHYPSGETQRVMKRIGSRPQSEDCIHLWDASPHGTVPLALSIPYLMQESHGNSLFVQRVTFIFSIECLWVHADEASLLGQYESGSCGSLPVAQLALMH